jgi:hypothetical protein
VIERLAASYPQRPGTFADRRGDIGSNCSVHPRYGDGNYIVLTLNL